MLSIQSIKTPFGEHYGPIALRYHKLNVPHYVLLVGEKGKSHFARMVTPSREQPGLDVEGLPTEYLAQLSELPERDMVLDRWDIVNLFSVGGVLDVLIDDLTHFDVQYLPDPPVQKYFKGIKESLPESPALASPQEKITRNCPE